jgi:amino acid adenylation domain-containing protein
MGFALLEHCKLFKQSIIDCETVLASIPNPPKWSLSRELAADTAESHVADARFSQPLCTAIQIALVDLLRDSGIRFHTVVGHSSGEIGAAYAAGLLNKRDAMGISYYRGCVTNLARGDTGQPGAMMAASMSFDTAKTHCSGPQFKDRITVAASNSPSSVTLSGDMDAISEMKKHLDERQIQTRTLQVDTAYHSHHMRACAEPYLSHLKELEITIQTPLPDHACRWYSSVKLNTDMLDKPLGSDVMAQYWVENLTHPVLFSEAVRLAVEANTAGFTAAIEVGPHGTLRGPVNQTLKQSDSTNQSMPYTACLNRNKNAIEAILEALTTIWNLEPEFVQFTRWRTAFGFNGSEPPLKNLPPYSWDHTQVHWRESRVAGNYRLSTQPPHDILGRLWNNSGSEQKWRNTLRLSEMPWLKGHIFQNQILFPATGYISLAVDAAKVFSKGQSIKFVELRDMTIPTALPIGEGDEVEILFTIRSRVSPSNAPGHLDSESVIEAEFTCCSYPNPHLEADKTCEGLLIIHLGVPEPTDLPPAYISDIELTPSNVDRFYNAASEIGFQYEGAFRALDSLNKCWGHAKAVASWSPEDTDMNITCTLHPAVLDVAFQTGLSTILSTAEGSMHSPYLPVGVKRVVIDPNHDFNTSVAIEAYMTSPTVGLGPRIETDINIKTLSNQTNVCEIQLEGVAFKAISEPQPSEDRNILAKTVWGNDARYGLFSSPIIVNRVKTDLSSYTSEEYERVALFYLRCLSQSVSSQEMDTLQTHHQKLIRYINVMAARILEESDCTHLKAEWLNDDFEMITDLLKRDPGDVNMVMLTSSAEITMHQLKKGSNQANGGADGREHLLSSLYQQTTWGTACNQNIAQMVVQISHTFPRASILHMCGGAAAETVSNILDTLDDAYASYTCTNTSQDIVDELREKIGLTSAREKRLLFEVFETKATKNLYDVVIVNNLCHARQNLSESVRILRSLLRPGGFLISMELTGRSLRPMAILGSSEEWWGNCGFGVDRPGINTGEWDSILSNNGFSGIDCIFQDQPELKLHGYSVFAAQAIDDSVEALRSPLTSLQMIPSTAVVFIGGETSQVSKLIRQGRNLLRDWATEIHVWSRFDQIDCSQIPRQCSVINLQDLDKPLFSSPPSVNELKNLKEILGSAQNILWATSGRLLEDPYANIMIGIGRSLRHEHIHLNLQFLDFDQGETWEIHTLMAQFLRLIFSVSSPSVMKEMVWVQEPEIVVKNSRLVTPRVVLDSASNNIYNANRRRVFKPVGPADPIEIVHETTGSSLEPILACSPPFNTPENHLILEVKLSVALHVNGEAPCYLSYGNLNNDGQLAAALALSDSDSSTVIIPNDFDFSSHVIQKCDALALVKIACFLIASNLVSRMPSSGTTLICGATDGLIKAVSVLSAKAERNIIFIAINEKLRRDGNPKCIYLHPQSSGRTVKKLIPHDANAMIDLSNGGAAFILPCLPSDCTTQAVNVSLITRQSINDAISNFQTHQDILSSVPTPAVISVTDLSRKPAGNIERLSVVTDWNRESLVKAMIRGLEPHTLLSPHKTYFLVGMAGELGQSLAYFLVRSGARYIVLSSRNPKDNQNWLRELRAVGVDIRMVKMDVTVRAQVYETVSKLRQTMPEIGGVTNAALVLEPAVFANLSAASIEKQLMPKVHGTAHLDEVFKNDPLDFFMCFGSLGTVFGNPGHAIYHAGNAFMMSLVANRKRRGLAGSILNFGMLVDVGYVARADRSAGSNVEEWLRTDGLIALSEADFHHVILQGIAVGKPHSPSHEVIMGVDTYYDRGQTPRPRWLGTPFLSHMVRRVSEARERDDTHSSGSHQSQLDNARTVEEAMTPIAELLSQKIKSMIHVSLDSIHPDEPLSRLGIDSINAIEIRKWLWERLKVEISMVKILGREPSVSIIRTIATQYLARKPEAALINVPNLDSSLGKEELKTINTQVNGNLAKVLHKADLDVQEDASSALNHSQTSYDSKASLSTPSQITPESSPISTPNPERALKFTRSERLSIAQAGLFYIDKFSDTRTTLNLTTRWRIDGPLDVQRLSRAIEMTINHHDALRTCFFAASDGTEIQQHLTSSKSFELHCLDSTVETAEFDAQKAFGRIKEHEYSVETGDTLQAVLVSHSAQQHTLVLGFHNLIIDVVSIYFILSDITREYQSHSRSEHLIPASYLDYTREQLDKLQAGQFKDSIQYWVHHLDPIPDVLPLLPVAKVRTRQSHRTYRHHYCDKELTSESVQTVIRIGQAHGITPMQFYLAAMQVFLGRLLNIDDVVIGVLHTGRDPISKFRQTVGHLASILPIRFNGILDKSLPEVMKNTRTTLLDGLDHADLPFALIVENIRPEISEGNMPLIQVAYNYTVDDSLPNTLGDCRLTVEKADFTTVYDFVLDVRRSVSGGHVLGITCTDDFYSLSATQFITETFFGVVEALIQEPLVAVKDCRLFSNTQLDRVRSAARTPAIQHSWSSSLPERFSEIAAKFPNYIAVKDGSETITYSELKQKVELYAEILVHAEVTSGTRVAVFCKPSIDLYASMLAVFWIAAIFVPLDVSVPAKRRNDMMRACKPHALVFHAATAKDVAESHMDEGSDIRRLNVTQLAQTRRKDASYTITKPISSESGADSHILFTSGSTGVPKGIRLHQRGIMNYAVVSSKRYGFGQIRVLQQTSIGFDVSFSQIYSAFTNGGTLVVASFESRGDPDMLSRLILDEKINFTMCTPSEYSLLLSYAPDRLRQCTDWHFAGAGGEVLPDRVVDGLRELKLPHLMLTNWYGPTEVTVITSQDIPVHDGASASGSQRKDKIGSVIGHIIPNNAIHILSEDDGSLMPLGMPGEICVTGIMVDNGYLDPSLDEGVFVKNPFATPEDVEQGFTTMYKTGDRGLVQEDGSVVFLGRTKRGSTVIKLRGLRIDLNEVTDTILEAAPDELADAAVTVRGEPQFLVCHISFKPGKRLDHQQLMDLLQTLPLPRYMIPATIVVLDRLPLVQNGKLDLELLRSLPLPAATAAPSPSSSEYLSSQAPRHIKQNLTELEERLRELWIDVIGAVAGVADIGLHSSFLAVGGNSYLLVHLQHAIKRDIGVRVPLPQLWQASDLKGMAVLIETELGRNE